MLSFNKVNIISLLFIGVLGFLKNENLISIWWILFVVLVWLILTIIGSFHIRWNYFLKVFHINDRIGESVIALTFDDGPNKEFTPKVLSLLKKHHAKATFFCIGENVKQHPEILKEIIKEGHLIGNHSYYHKNSFGFLSTSQVVEELENTQKIIEEKVNLNIRFFRPPFGVTNPNIAKAVKNLNLYTFGWSIRSLDTIAKDPEKVYDKIVSKIKKGDVVLMHDSSELSAVVLEKLLLYLDKNNIKTITLDKLFNLKAYE
jgi:peptidoglycan/xylan/chitin deacetylase (PgdA/CDA1 family)